MKFSFQLRSSIPSLTFPSLDKDSLESKKFGDQLLEINMERSVINHLCIRLLSLPSLAK
jgi:hypothetical protein